MKDWLRTVLATAAWAAERTWTTFRGIVRSVRSVRRTHAHGPSATRRGYVFGAISRKAFDAAMRKRRGRRSRIDRAA